MGGLNLSTGARRNQAGSNSAPDLMSHVRLLPISDESEKNGGKINTKKISSQVIHQRWEKKSCWPL